jgi:hypothetical protein
MASLFLQRNNCFLMGPTMAIILDDVVCEDFDFDFFFA